MKYVAIIEEKTIHRVEFSTDDNNPDDVAFELFDEGIIVDDDPYRDSITILSVDTKEEHDGVANGDM